MTATGLPLWRGPLPEEPAHGLAMRLAEVNGLSHSSMVYDHLGLSATRLRRGEQLDELAAAVRRPTADVARDSFSVDDDGITVRVRGVPLNFKHDYDQFRRRACPACLRDSAHHRFWWDVTMISTCPRHGLVLEERCDCAADKRLSWRDGRLWRCLQCRGRPAAEAGDLRLIAGTPADPEIAAMDAYLAGRLGVVPARPVAALDRFELHPLMDVLERVGSLHHAGWSKTWKSAADIEDRSVASVRATGFRLLAEDALLDTLEAVFQGYETPPGIEPMLTTAYGWFYHWYNLKGGMRFSPEITETIYRHASTRFRIDRRAMREKSVVVSETTARQIDAFDASSMILSDAAKACGQHITKVRRLAVAYGLMRGKKMTGRIVRLETADVGVIGTLLDRMVDRRSTCGILGMDPRGLAQFEAAGVITPIFAGASDGGRRFGYLCDDVLDLVASFEDRAEQCVKNRPRDAIRMLDQRLRPRIGLIVAAVSAGTLRPIKLIGDAPGLQRYCFRRSEVEALADVPGGAVKRPDFEHWRRRVAKIRARSGGLMPPKHEAAGRGWSPYTTPMMQARLKASSP